jgi:hypothetical protein
MMQLPGKCQRVHAQGRQPPLDARQLPLLIARLRRLLLAAGGVTWQGRGARRGGRGTKAWACGAAWGCVAAVQLPLQERLEEAQGSGPANRSPGGGGGVLCARVPVPGDGSC